MSKFADGTTLCVTLNQSTGALAYGRMHDVLGALWRGAPDAPTITLPPESALAVPVFANDAVAWERIAGVARTTAPLAATRIELGTGAAVRVTPAVQVLLWQNNRFQMRPLDEVGDAVPTSLFLPSRVGQQVAGGLSVTVQMAQSPPDPLALVRFDTETWGPVAIPHGALPKFKAATTSVPDIGVIQTLQSTPVQFSVVAAVDRDAPSEGLPMYWLTTTTGANWMTAHGIFLG